MKKNQKYLLVLVIAAAVVFIMIRGNYTNSVIFTGDEWEYQSIGVNFYYGHDFLTTGLIENAETYKITSLDEGKMEFWKRFSGFKAIHRSPLYPFFICSVYKVAGINPVLVKYIQLLILFVSAFLLIIIGRYLWGDKGFYIGIASFLAFIILNYKYPEHLMPETFQSFFLHLLILCTARYYRGSIGSAIAAGIILGISALNKGTMILLFPMMIIYGVYRIWTSHKHNYTGLIMFAAGFLVVTGSGSMMLSIEQNRFIYISTQGNEVLLDGNNELCADGLWHPEWRENNSSYYHHDHGENWPSLFRVFQFYYNNPNFLFNLFPKITHGFCVLPSSIFCFAFGFILLFIRWIQKAKAPLFVPAYFYLVFLNFLIFTLLFYADNETYLSRYVKTMDGVFLLTGLYFLCEAYSFIYVKLKHHSNEK